MQGRFVLAVTRDIDNADAAGIVRPLQVVHIAEGEVIVLNVDRIACAHTHIALNAVVLAEGNADNRHRHAQMAQHHSPVAAGKMG